MVFVCIPRTIAQIDSEVSMNKVKGFLKKYENEVAVVVAIGILWLCKYL